MNRNRTDKGVKFILVLICLALIAVGVVVLISGIKKNEKVQCKTWRARMEEYPNYYVTDWQEKQCKRYDIDL